MTYQHVVHVLVVAVSELQVSDSAAGLIDTVFSVISLILHIRIQRVHMR